jgi:hypothetical protein
MERAAVAVHEDLKRGLNPLATITCIAPFIGILGTVWAIAFDTFFGVGIDKLTGLAIVAEGLSRACLPSALGLAVGLQSLWYYNYFRGRVEQFDLEMVGESLKLLNELTLRLGTVQPLRRIEPFNPSVRYLERYHVTAPADRRSRRRSSSAAVALLVAAWCIQVVRDFGYGLLPPGPALRAACLDVLIPFGCSWLIGYGVWVGLLHRKSRGLFLAAAAFSFFWCVAELLVPVLRF